MKGKYLVELSLVLGTLVLASCGSETDSEHVNTSGMRADIEVIADGSGDTSISVELEVGSESILDATDINLSEGDELIASGNSQSKTLTPSRNFWEDLAYAGEFNFDEAGTEFVVAFERQSETDAPNSNVILPAPFTILEPQQDDLFDIEDDISVTWEASEDSDEIRITTTSQCPIAGGNWFSGTTLTTEDDGVFTFSAENALGSEPGDAVQDSVCDVVLRVMRINHGNLDPAYGEGGSIRALQVRTTEIRILL